MQERQQQQQQQQTNGFSEIKSKDEIDRVVINDCFKKGQAPPPPPVCLQILLFFFFKLLLIFIKYIKCKLKFVYVFFMCFLYVFFLFIVCELVDILSCYVNKNRKCLPSMHGHSINHKFMCLIRQ